MQIEETAFAYNSNKEAYMNFFQNIFTFANKTGEINYCSLKPFDSRSLILPVRHNNNVQNPSIVSSHVTHEIALNYIRRLLPDEPATLQESVAKGWSEINSEIEKISLSSDDAGIDQAFTAMKLTPDEFETGMTNLLDVFRKSHD